ncbi:mevalonate kinase family protein [Neolewinella litorea]|uniref:mevalonate kinase n=1 Tax=Neolewinella litorea TaxID=2562452 RepID=A0A4S4NGH3_9BACT|nr:hypothetical protein [Neolewinella litorea]THH37757.1 hypothetical protein E4021_13775 [Neolewinella litorea]
MMDDPAPLRSYPAKVLLYGEHNVLRGGQGLAVPYPRLSLRWVRGERDPRLAEFAAYLQKSFSEVIDADRFRHDVDRGARLSGNIPTGYGLGSSGAVCAAVWDRYALHSSPSRSTSELRDLLARLECFFHGSSSGTDPLISYLDRPLLLGGGATDGRRSAGPVELPDAWSAGFFLVDTGIERTAAPLIEHFLARFDREPGAIRAGWLEPANRAIAALRTHDRPALYAATAAISEYQLEHFPRLIPEDWWALWNGGEAYRLKLCGAGGGGMMLGLALDPQATRRALGDELLWL